MPSNRPKINRSLWTTVKGGWPDNLQEALMWLLYTFLAAALAFVASALINYGRHGAIREADLIGHGELFTFTSSMLMGAVLLVSKDKGLEPFKARRLFTLIVFASAIFAELGFITLKLTSEGDLQWVPIDPVRHSSIYLAVFCVSLIFSIVLIDSSRIDAYELITEVEQSHEDLSQRMGEA